MQYTEVTNGVITNGVYNIVKLKPEISISGNADSYENNLLGR